MKFNFWNYSITLTVSRRRGSNRGRRKATLDLRIISAVLVVAGVSTAILMTSCASTPPKSLSNVCSIFEEKGGWYKDAKKSSERWNSPIPVMMAILHQESRFNAKAKPPRRKILWIIPGPRISSAYGYSQAKGTTWDWYKQSTGKRGADRDDFADAIDFVGWYNNLSHTQNNIQTNDAYNLYLAYHEGHGGFNRRTYRNKEWLTGVAGKVSRLSQEYTQQLASCQEDLESPWYWPF